MTNSPTKPAAPLSEEALAEIEARKVTNHHIESGAYIGCYILLSTAERDALCQTVRAARAENEALEQFNVRLTTGLVNIYHVVKGEACKHGVALGMATSAVSSMKSENAALREQLAQRTIELERESRETQKWNNRANQLAIEGQELRQRLAQVEKERFTLTEEEIRLLTDHHYLAAERAITRRGDHAGQQQHLERLAVIRATKDDNHEH